MYMYNSLLSLICLHNVARNLADEYLGGCDWSCDDQWGKSTMNDFASIYKEDTAWTSAGNRTRDSKRSAAKPTAGKRE